MPFDESKLVPVDDFESRLIPVETEPPLTPRQKVSASLKRELETVRSQDRFARFFGRPESLIPPLLLPPEAPGSVENLLRRLPLGAGADEALHEERVRGIAAAPRAIEEGIRSAGLPESLPILPVAALPGGAPAMALLFGGGALGAGVGEASVGFQQGEPETAGRGVGTALLGAALLPGARAGLPERAAAPLATPKTPPLLSKAVQKAADDLGLAVQLQPGIADVPPSLLFDYQPAGGGGFSFSLPEGSTAAQIRAAFKVKQAQFAPKAPFDESKLTPVKEPQPAPAAAQSVLAAERTGLTPAELEAAAAGGSPSAPAPSTPAESAIPPAIRPRGTASPLKEAFEKFDDTGEIETIRDLVDEVERLTVEGKAPESLTRAVEAYREAEREDFRELAGRGDMDAAEEAFLASLKRAISKEKRVSKPPVPSGLRIEALGMAESDLTLPKLRTLPARNPQQWAQVKKYFGFQTVPEIHRAAQRRFGEMRARAEAPLAAPTPETPSPAAAPTKPSGPLPLTSVGPGAASPLEFAARIEKARRGETPPADNPPVTITGTPAPDLVRKARDFTTLNRVNSPQFTFWFGRLGEAAKAAWERLALGEFNIREGVGRDVSTYVDGLLSNLPRPLRRKGGRAFFDVLDGQTTEQITAAWQGRPGGDAIIAATEVLRGRLEEIRTTIRDTKRDAYHAFLNGMDRATLEDLFRKNISDAIDTGNWPKSRFADALTRSELPDDWGIADGSYLPHLFMGQWRGSYRAPGADAPSFAFRARTPAEAKARLHQMVRDNPGLADATWTIEPDAVVPADSVRLGDRNFWRLVGEMKESAGVSAAEIRQAMQGVIGRKSARQKWWGSLQRRQGFGGYERNYRKVLTAYLNGFHRWRELSAANRDAQPLIEQVRREGRPSAAAALDEILDGLWGKPAKSTVEFDALLQRVPVLRDHVKPLALDRWSQNLRTAVAFLTLTTPRFALVNRLQPLQGLYPLVGERLFARAKVLQHTAEGRSLLDEAGVRFDPGQFAERGAVSRLRGLRERLTGERTNQEWAFLSMYLHGLEKGLEKSAAIRYAKLRGQLLTQFTPLLADTPPIMRGPFTSLLFQFKRFPVKQAELLVRMAQDRNLSGLARWLASMAFMGGLSYYARQFLVPADRRERLRRDLAQQHGGQIADALTYGLPGLVGMDISGSLVLGDEPFGANLYEKAGRQVAGPAVSLTRDVGTALTTAERLPTATAQEIETLLRRIPTLRPLAEAIALTSGNYDVRSPDGEVRYRRTLKDVLLGLGSFRSARESNLRSALNAIIELEKESAALKNRWYASALAGDSAAAIEAIRGFNQRWPEVAITGRELQRYRAQRDASAPKTDVERVAGRKFAPLIPR